MPDNNSNNNDDNSNEEHVDAASLTNEYVFYSPALTNATNSNPFITVDAHYIPLSSYSFAQRRQYVYQTINNNNDSFNSPASENSRLNNSVVTEPVKSIDYDGTITWKLNGVYHREDGPAIVYSTGEKYWYFNGEYHREDGPAVINNSTKEWYKHGQRHREDGPAVIINGRKEWWINGRNHREDGPAIEFRDGGKEWFINGRRHREDGPAVEHSIGEKYWFINGHKHREDGPAVILANGSKQWWLNDSCIYNEQLDSGLWF